MVTFLLGNKVAIIFQDTAVNVTAVVGQSITLDCAPQGEIGIIVTWIPDYGQSYNEKYGGVLRIDNVTLTNEGVYNCSYKWNNKTSGKELTGSRLFYLTVKGSYFV